MDSAERNARPSAAFVAVFAVAAVAAIAALWCVPYVPTNDGPQHVFAGLAAGELRDAAHPLHAFVERGSPVTALGFHLPFRAMPGGWMLRLQLVLSLVILAKGAGFAWLAHRWAPGRPLLAALGFGFAFTWAFYMGFFPFGVAVAFAPWVLALHEPDAPLRSRNSALVAALLLAQAIAHVVPAAFTGALVLAAELARKGPTLGTLRSAALGALPASIGVLAASLSASSVGATEASVWESWGTALATVPRMFATGPAWRWVLPWLGVLGALAALARWRSEPARARLALGATAALGALLCLVAPLDFAGWQLFAGRPLAVFAPVAMLAALAALPAGKVRAGVDALAFAWVLGSLSWAASYHTRLAAFDAPIREVAGSELERTGPRWAVVFTPQGEEPIAVEERTVPFANPWRNLGVVLASSQGGYGTSFFGGTAGIHPIVERPGRVERYPGTPPPYFYLAAAEAEGVARDAIVAELASVASWSWSDVPVFGDAEDVEAFVARGFVADARSSDGRAALLRFQGCPVAVRFPDENPPIARIEVGWAPLLAPRSGFAAPLSGPGDVAVERAPCGLMWLRVFADANGDGRWQPREPTCQGGDAEGRIVFTATAAGGTLPCTW